MLLLLLLPCRPSSFALWLSWEPFKCAEALRRVPPEPPLSLMLGSPCPCRPITCTGAVSPEPSLLSVLMPSGRTTRRTIMESTLRVLSSLRLLQHHSTEHERLIS